MSTTPSAERTAAPASRPGDTHPWLRRLLIINLVCQVGIIVTGGLVRLTGSGLGCPTWPQCVPGSYVPTVEQEEGIHKLIEFGNRTLTGVLGVVALALIWALYRWARERRDLQLGAWGILAGVAAQAIVGGITVLTGLNPWIVAFHFLCSAALVAVATWLIFREREPAGRREVIVHPLVHQAGLAVCVLAGVVLVLGTIVTGSGPHSGDADTPARTGLDPRAMSWLHADTVMLFAGLVIAVWIGARISGRTEVPGQAWGWVVAVTAAQGLVGYTQYFLDLPEVLVLAHMLLASLLVVTITRAMVLSRRSVSSDLAAAGGAAGRSRRRGRAATRT